MKNVKIRWAIVGLGAQAEKIAGAIRDSRNGILVAVADRNIRRAEAFSGRCNAQASFVSLGELLQHAEVDVVFIASPNYLHAAQSISALKAGKHVLCEKPMTLTLKEATAVKRAVEKSGKKFGVGFHLRFHPLFREAKKIVASGKLGKIVFADMHWSVGTAGKTELGSLPEHMRWRENIAQSGGGVLMARGVHLFDLLKFLTGEDVRGAAVFSDSRTGKAVEQLTAGTVRSDGFFATLATGRKIPFAFNRVIIHGSRGSLFMPEPFNSDGTGILEVNIMGRKEVKRFNKKSNLHLDEIKNFSDAILKNKKWAGADAGDGISAVRAAGLWVRASNHSSKR